MTRHGDVRSGRGAAAGLLRLDATRALAAFFGVGGLLCWVTLRLPHDPSLRVPGVALVGCLALLAAAGLLLARRVPQAVCSVLVGVGSGLIGLLVVSAPRSAEAVGFAGFIVWVAVYAAMFFPVRLAAAHCALGAGAVALGWQWSGRPWLDVVLVLSATGSTALVVGDLVDRVRRAAEHDAVTGLLTREGLARRVPPVLDTARHSGDPVAVLVLKLRGLDQVVAALGHAAGDELLARVGAALLAAGDSNGVLGARLSNDHLAAVLQAQSLASCGRRALAAGVAAGTVLDRATWAARETLQLIRGPHRVHGVDLQLEGHVGLVLADRADEDLPALLRAGEAALAEAVRRDVPVRCFDEGLAAIDSLQLQLLAELREAVPRGELRLHYQVQVAAHTGRPASVEALVRWQHPRLGLLAPGTFLPVAETTDVIVELTRWVLDEALRQCAQWLAAGLRVPVAVNLSARLLTHAGLPDEVAGRLLAHAVPAELLTLEITETSLVAHPEQAADVIRRLRSQGLRVSLDDFGTGQTSLELLAGLDIDELKIDRAFVAAGRADPRAGAIVRSVLHLGHGLGQQVVAEGVEDADTGRWLAELGCDLLQGFHHGRPQPAAALSDLPIAVAVPAGASEVGDYRGRAPVLPPEREQARLAALQRLEVLDTPRETSLDDLAALAAQVCGVAIGLVSLVDRDRQWFKATAGCDLTQTPRSQAFCAHALDRVDILEVPDARVDVRFSDNPLVTGPPHVRFYAGAPLRTVDGHTLGTLCVLDSSPRTLNEQQRQALVTLAASVAARLQQPRGAATPSPSGPTSTVRPAPGDT